MAVQNKVVSPEAIHTQTRTEDSSICIYILVHKCMCTHTTITIIGEENYQFESWEVELQGGHLGGTKREKEEESDIS